MRAHSIVDHPCLVLSFSGPCLWAPGWGEPGFRGGPCPGLVVFLLLPVIQDVVVVSSYCFVTDQVAWTTRKLREKKIWKQIPQESFERNPSQSPSQTKP